MPVLSLNEVRELGRSGVVGRDVDGLGREVDLLLVGFSIAADPILHGRLRDFAGIASWVP